MPHTKTVPTRPVPIEPLQIFVPSPYVWSGRLELCCDIVCAAGPCRAVLACGYAGRCSWSCAEHTQNTKIKRVEQPP